MLSWIFMSSDFDKDTLQFALSTLKYVGDVLPR